VAGDRARRHRHHQPGTIGKLRVACLLAAGRICASCGPDGCGGTPASEESLIFDDLPCPDCGGAGGCHRCGGRNVFVAAGCPAKLVNAESVEAIRLMKFADRGFLPRSGGLDAQRHRDVRLIEHAWAETNVAAATPPAERDDA
jgi:hypothetical protein